MSEVNRRQFGVLAILGGIGVLARAALDLEGDLPPTPADPSVADGRFVWITLPSGRTIRRVCQKGQWITTDPAN